MARDSAIPPESFDEILAWLNPDREVAGDMLVQLRQDLEKIFQWRGCSDPEGLTDEVFDRVAKKVHEVRPTYEGDPRHYFRKVAKNVALEDIKKRKTYLSLEDIDPSEHPKAEVKDETAAEREDECLQLCLRELSDEKRELIKAYYAKDKQAKIDHRGELAEQLGIKLQTLWVRVHRIRESLDKCIDRCLKDKAQQK